MARVCHGQAGFVRRSKWRNPLNCDKFGIGRPVAWGPARRSKGAHTGSRMSPASYPLQLLPGMTPFTVGRSVRVLQTRFFSGATPR
jgi:hypothetical protein